MAANGLSISRSAASLLGYEDGHLEPHLEAWTGLLHPADRHGALRAWARYRRGRTAAFECDARLRNGKGEWTLAHVSGDIVAVHSDRLPRQVVGALTLITDPDGADSWQARARRLEGIGALCGGLLHDLSTPVHYIGGNLDFLKTLHEPLAPLLALCAPASEALQAASSGTDLARRFAAAVDAADLAYTTLEMPRAVEDSVEGVARIGDMLRAMKEFLHPPQDAAAGVNLNQLIDTTVAVARPQWRHTASVVTALDADMPPVACRAEDVQQIVLGLLLHTVEDIRETQAAGSRASSGALDTITIATRAVDSAAEIRIAHTGGGTSDADDTRRTLEGVHAAQSTIEGRRGVRVRVDHYAGTPTTIVVTLPIGSEQAHRAHPLSAG
jgi:signal transduction histidine kinase